MVPSHGFFYLTDHAGEAYAEHADGPFNGEQVAKRVCPGTPQSAVAFLQDKENPHAKSWPSHGDARSGDRCSVNSMLAQDDSRWRKLMDEAFNRRYRWNENLKGFGGFQPDR